MITKEDVQKFLDEFYIKVKIFDIRFRDDRGKNQQALVDLEITTRERMNVVMNINAEDYSEGPIINELNKTGELWVFGKDVKGSEVYIKISLGLPNSNTICVSFHIAEHPMTYPFKS